MCKTSLSAEETSATISYNKCSLFDWSYIKAIVLLKCISVKENLATIPLYSVGGHCKPKGNIKNTSSNAVEASHCYFSSVLPVTPSKPDSHLLVTSVTTKVVQHYFTFPLTKINKTTKVSIFADIYCLKLEK